VRGFSARDGGRYPGFIESVGRISRVLRAVLAATPPSIHNHSASDFVEALKAGRAFRALGKPDEYRLLRWLPMAAADFAAEWFESEPPRATLAASGTLRAVMW